MAHDPQVCEVLYPSQVPLCHFNGDWEELVQNQNGHAVWDVDHLVITGDLGDEVARVVEI